MTIEVSTMRSLLLIAANRSALHIGRRVENPVNPEMVQLVRGAFDDLSHEDSKAAKLFSAMPKPIQTLLFTERQSIETVEMVDPLRVRMLLSYMQICGLLPVAPDLIESHEAYFSGLCGKNIINPSDPRACLYMGVVTFLDAQCETARWTNDPVLIAGIDFALNVFGLLNPELSGEERTHLLGLRDQLQKRLPEVSVIGGVTFDSGGLWRSAQFMSSSLGGTAGVGPSVEDRSDTLLTEFFDHFKEHLPLGREVSDIERYFRSSSAASPGFVFPQSLDPADRSVINPLVIKYYQTLRALYKKLVSFKVNNADRLAYTWANFEGDVKNFISTLGTAVRSYGIAMNSEWVSFFGSFIPKKVDAEEFARLEKANTVRVESGLGISEVASESRVLELDPIDEEATTQLMKPILVKDASGYWVFQPKLPEDNNLLPNPETPIDNPYKALWTFIHRAIIVKGFMPVPMHDYAEDPVDIQKIYDLLMSLKDNSEVVKI